MEGNEPKFIKLVDSEAKKRELDRLVEASKNNLKFIKMLKERLLEEIAELTFPVFYSQYNSDLNDDANFGSDSAEQKPDSILDFEIDLEEKTKQFSEIGQIESYCKRNNISFPAAPRVEQLKRLVAITLRFTDPEFKEK